MHSTQLHRARVNVKSLAAEARIIREEILRISRHVAYCLMGDDPSEEEEASSLQASRHALQQHRRGRLREESRLAQLSLAFLRGKPYKLVEPKTRNPMSWPALQAKLKRFGLEVPNDELRDWLLD